jgi:hypothetical protein
VKDLNPAYREAARRLYGKPGAKVPTYGQVQQLRDEGAFVEMVVWVDAFDLEESPAALEGFDNVDG